MLIIVEYRTKTRMGIVYPSCFAYVGSHLATNTEDAQKYVLSRYGNVEIINVQYAPYGP